MPEGSCSTIRTAIRATTLGTVLTAAAILGLVATRLAIASPADASSQVPAATPVTTAAVFHATASDEESLVVPRGIGNRASATPAASEAPVSDAPTTTDAATPATPAEAPQLVTLPPLGMDVWNATERYFAVSGSTPEELIASATANVPADPTGTERSAMAYAGPIAWDHRPSYVQDPATGTCTMTGITSSVAYQATLPQWASPASVPPELLAWWRLVIDHIGVHESQHIRIFQDYVSVLPSRIVGQPCGAWDAIIGQWSGDVANAQAAFDAAEAGWALPAYAGPVAASH